MGLFRPNMLADVIKVKRPGTKPKTVVCGGSLKRYAGGTTVPKLPY
jgi:hypothetical protein